MNIKLKAISFLFFFSTAIQAQDKIALNNQDGIFVSYELTKIESGSKKDSYLAVVKAENKNDFDIYYAVSQSLQTSGTTTSSILGNTAFAQISVRNATGLFGGGASLAGQQTKMVTNDNKVLFSISKGSFVTSEREFKVKTGEKPVITNSFLLPLKQIDNFDLAISEAMVNGDWIADCGKIQMALSLSKNEKNEPIIQQLINGRKNIWKKTTANGFEKLNDNTTTLSYNKQNNSFTYSNTDGVVCTWVRK